MAICAAVMAFRQSKNSNDVYYIYAQASAQSAMALALCHLGGARAVRRIEEGFPYWIAQSLHMEVCCWCGCGPLGQ